ncbi:penicillin-binding transpeptidase domain-containing protein [Streptomyces sp. AK04-3B]|uniref:penicillin-binding transpeptidase domain-containing protein n=1 Tax=unclassified Streptomyces TaxID=2593676 RepID=UPI0029B8AD96|nr:penicillin-binding transpeptidase domain-containing protein [Streptomyces sp. AK04-3B]MDX3799326.1 penicillin-binding transpeptidase domain-containing protein [Streptomyces sp. AK04-3B]
MHTTTRGALRVSGILAALATVTSGCGPDAPADGASGAPSATSPSSPAKRGLGDILVGGKAVTGSQPTGLAKAPYRRTYTDGALYAPVTGYRSMAFGASGLERVYDDVLGAGASGAAPGDVATTIEPAVQKAAFGALGDRRGAAVALDAESGKLLALVSTPSYDPAMFSGRSTKDAQAWKSVLGDSRSPMLNRALRQADAPGATFSVVVAAAALEQGLYATVDDATVSPLAYVLPLSTTRVTGASSACVNASIKVALRNSCANVFTKMAAELGQGRLRSEAQKFGFDDDTLAVPVRVAESSYPGAGTSAPAAALTGIGAGDVRATVLQMARVAAAVANDGRLVPPQLVERVTQAGGTARKSEAGAGSPVQAVSRGTAEALRAALGSGGQTGWVPGDGGDSAASWFIGQTETAGGRRIAVAVRVEGLPSTAGADADGGGRAAAKVAEKILAGVGG